MVKYYLAIDIGASSGRHILAHKEEGNIVIEEIYRFPNGMLEKDEELVWDIDKLFDEIKTGMKRCVELNKIPVSVGIDTWAVDFVLLDEEGERVGKVMAYRDKRTEGMVDEVHKYISEEELYRITGIQKQSFNTIYQLMAIKKQNPEQLEKARKLLMIPDYLHYLLTGKVATEYTNATTTQLVSLDTKTWNRNLIEKLGFSQEIFQSILPAGSELGYLSDEMKKELGFDCKVVLPATHDTGSAVIAVPTNQTDTLYISSGTWSLMGTELIEANCTLESKTHNLTNEGGYEYRYRFLKNIMGLWMIQSVKSEIGEKLSFPEICEGASKQKIASIIDCNDSRFLAPENMTLEVCKACLESGQQVPIDIAEVAAVIYNSLAQCYSQTIKEIEKLTNKKYSRIHIVGGGANAEFLNRLTAKVTKLPVYAGPIEATAIGNIAVQMLAGKDLKSLQEARSCIYRSFPIIKYE